MKYTRSADLGGPVTAGASFALPCIGLPVVGDVCINVDLSVPRATIKVAGQECTITTTVSKCTLSVFGVELVITADFANDCIKGSLEVPFLGTVEEDFCW
jgi:hypothetical protein